MGFFSSGDDNDVGPIQVAAVVVVSQHVSLISKPSASHLVLRDFFATCSIRIQPHITKNYSTQMVNATFRKCYSSMGKPYHISNLVLQSEFGVIIV